MADNRYTSYTNSPDSLGMRGVVVTPGVVDLPSTVKAVMCLTAGNITIVPLGNGDNETIAFVGVPAGFIPPYRVRRVTAATSTVYTIEG